MNHGNIFFRYAGMDANKTPNLNDLGDFRAERSVDTVSSPQFGESGAPEGGRVPISSMRLKWAVSGTDQVDAAVKSENCWIFWFGLRPLKALRLESVAVIGQLVGMPPRGLKTFCVTDSGREEVVELVAAPDCVAS